MKLYKELFDEFFNQLKNIENTKSEEKQNSLISLLNLLKNNKPFFFFKSSGYKYIKSKLPNTEIYNSLAKSIYGYVFCKSLNLVDIIDLIDCLSGYEEFYNKISTWNFTFKGDKYWKT